MGKAPDAFRTISEVADWLGVQTHVLRFWESKFSQIKPLKRAGGRRYYRPADMELLGGLRKLLHEDGLTIKGAQKFLRENGVKAVMAISPPVEGSAESAEAPPSPSGQEAAAAMAPDAVMPQQPEREDEVRQDASEPQPEVARVAELHVFRNDADTPEVTGKDDAAEENTSEAPAPGADLHVLRDDADQTVDVTGEQPAPEGEVTRTEDPSPAAREEEQDEDLSLPSFIRNPMAPDDTVTPSEAPEKIEEAAFAGVGNPQMPDLTEMAQHEGSESPEPEMPSGEDEAPGDLAPVNFAVGVAPEPTMPAPSTMGSSEPVSLDPESLRPFYDRLVALRVRMG